MLHTNLCHNTTIKPTRQQRALTPPGNRNATCVPPRVAEVYRHRKLEGLFFFFFFHREINEKHQNQHIPTYSPRSVGHSTNIQTGVSEIPFHIVWQRARPIRPSGTWEVQQRHGDCTCGGARQEGTPTKAPYLFHAFPRRKPLRTRSVMGQFAQE